MNHNNSTVGAFLASGTSGVLNPQVMGCPVNASITSSPPVATLTTGDEVSEVFGFNPNAQSNQHPAISASGSMESSTMHVSAMHVVPDVAERIGARVYEMVSLPTTNTTRPLYQTWNSTINVVFEPNALPIHVYSVNSVITRVHDGSVHSSTRIVSYRTIQSPARVTRMVLPCGGVTIINEFLTLTSDYDPYEVESDVDSSSDDDEDYSPSDDDSAHWEIPTVRSQLNGSNGEATNSDDVVCPSLHLITFAYTRDMHFLVLLLLVLTSIPLSYYRGVTSFRVYAYLVVSYSFYYATALLHTLLWVSLCLFFVFNAKSLYNRGLQGLINDHSTVMLIIGVICAMYFVALLEDEVSYYSFYWFCDCIVFVINKIIVVKSQLSGCNGEWTNGDDMADARNAYRARRRREMRNHRYQRPVNGGRRDGDDMAPAVPGVPRRNPEAHFEPVNEIHANPEDVYIENTRRKEMLFYKVNHPISMLIVAVTQDLATLVALYAWIIDLFILGLTYIARNGGWRGEPQSVYPNFQAALGIYLDYLNRTALMFQVYNADIIDRVDVVDTLIPCMNNPLHTGQTFGQINVSLLSLAKYHFYRVGDIDTTLLKELYKSHAGSKDTTYLHANCAFTLRTFREDDEYPDEIIDNTIVYFVNQAAFQAASAKLVTPEEPCIPRH